MKKMTKNDRIYIGATAFAVLLPFLVTLLFWNSLPERIPTHFNIAGEADGYSSRAFAVFFLPLFLTAVHLFCAFFTRQDPKFENISPKVFRLILWICPLVSLFLAATIFRTAFRQETSVSTLGMKIFLGILFIAIGNYLPKCRQNYTVGIKLPWTLHDEDNWNRTHRLGGWLFVLGGIITILTAFLPEAAGSIIMLVSILAILVITTAYSWMIYRSGI